MKKIGFLYAGQGSQKIGMGREFYEQYPSFKATFDSAPVDFSIAELCFNGTEEKLSQTELTQPCMTAMAVGITDILREKGVTPVMTTGLSLGEYGALYCGGVLDAQTTIALTAFRGAQMTKAAQGIDCGMYAILGVDKDALSALCAEKADLGVAEVANCNCPGQIVISGEKVAVDAVADAVKEMGKRALPLKVSGPFHTSLMKKAGDALNAKFTEINFCAPQIPVAFNATGKTLQNGESIPALLETQVQSTVYFEDCLRTMIDAGVEVFFEIGAGAVLGGFMKRIDRNIPVYPISTPEELEKALEAVKGE